MEAQDHSNMEPEASKAPNDASSEVRDIYFNSSKYLPGSSQIVAPDSQTLTTDCFR